MNAPDPSPHRGSRSRASLPELPLVTVLTAATVVLVVGLRDGGAPRATTAPDGGAERNVVVARAPVVRGPERAAAPSLAPVLPAAPRDPLAPAADRGDEAPTSGDARTRPALFSMGGDAGLPGSVERGGGSPVRRDGLRQEGSFRGGVRHGAWLFRDPDGMVREEGRFDLGLRDGAWKTYAVTGALLTDAQYVDGELHGPWRAYTEAGDLVEEGGFVESHRSGRWTLYYSNGSIKERGRYESGLREGHWEFYDDLGRPTLRTGTYRAGIRVD